jgi:transcriptional regulator with GAF, ATPase, and Fis domain
MSLVVMEIHGKTLTERLNALEKEAILDALSETGWVKARAARILGITERMIGYKIKKYGISKEVARREMYQ